MNNEVLYKSSADKKLRWYEYSTQWTMILQNITYKTFISQYTGTERTVYLRWAGFEYSMNTGISVYKSTLKTHFETCAIW